MLHIVLNFYEEHVLCTFATYMHVSLLFIWFIYCLTYIFVHDNRYSQGSGTIWLDNVRCTSGDIFLADCSHSGFYGVKACVHSEDVAVSCTQEGLSSNPTVEPIIL